nr:antitoxin [Propioniciclava soli]
MYIRDVPEAVAATLKERAAAQGTSLSSYVAAELARIAARPTNEDVAARLRARDRAEGPSRAEIVAAVENSRP